MVRKFRVTYIGGPWGGRFGVATEPLLNSLAAQSPEPPLIDPTPGEPPDVVYIWWGTAYHREIDVDKLVTGAELDRLVNERVLGKGPVQAPRFSVSPAEANRLEQHLRTLGWTRVDRDMRPGPATPGAYVQLTHDVDQSVSAVGRTFEEALCKAALKAVEP